MVTPSAVAVAPPEHVEPSSLSAIGAQSSALQSLPVSLALYSTAMRGYAPESASAHGVAVGRASAHASAISPAMCLSFICFM